MTAPPCPPPRLALQLLFFLASTLLIVGVGADTIPVLHAPKVVYDSARSGRVEVSATRDQRVWYAPTEHELGLVRDSIEKSVREGVFHSGGFPVYMQRPYLSSAGLYNIVFGAMAPDDPAELGRYYQFLSRLLLLLSALAISLVAVCVWNEFGFAPAAALVIAMATSNWYIEFSRSLYWCLALSLAPMVAVWMLYARAVAQRRLRRLWLVVFGLSTIKFLFGYEYATNVILMAAMPILLVAGRSGVSLARAFGHTVAMCLAAVAGFFLALLVNFGQAWMWLGSFELTHQRLLGRFGRRTFAEDAGHSYWPADATSWDVFRDYLDTDVLSINLLTRTPVMLSTLDLVIGLGAIAVVYLLTLIGSRHLRDPRLERLILVAAAALAVSSSWAFLAPNHMLPHPFVNPVIFSLPFIPFAALAFGRFFVVAARNFRDPRSTPTASPASEQDSSESAMV